MKVYKYWPKDCLSFDLVKVNSLHLLSTLSYSKNPASWTSQWALAQITTRIETQCTDLVTTVEDILTLMPHKDNERIRLRLRPHLKKQRRNTFTRGPAANAPAMMVWVQHQIWIQESISNVGTAIIQGANIAKQCHIENSSPRECLRTKWCMTFDPGWYTIADLILEPVGFDIHAENSLVDLIAWSCGEYGEFYCWDLGEAQHVQTEDRTETLFVAAIFLCTPDVWNQMEDYDPVS